MTLTAMTEAAEAPAPAPAGLAGTVPVMSEKLQARLIDAQIRQQAADAEEKRRQAREAAAARQRREDRAFQAEQAAQARKEKDERKAAATGRRAAARAKATEAASEHAIHLMFGPLIVFPAMLAWEPMTEFGRALFGPLGPLLPVLTETGMWIADFAILWARWRAAKAGKDPVLWPLFTALAFFAGVCAATNFSHGLLGPIPGSIQKGTLPGLLYAVVALSGMITHQLIGLASRMREKKPPRKAGRGDAPRAGFLRRLVAGDHGGSRGGIRGGAASGHRGGARGGTGGGGAQPVVAGTVAAALPAGQQPASAPDGNSAITPEGPASFAGDLADGAEEPARPVDAKAVMREFWDKEIAAGRIPTGGDLNHAAGNERNYSLGRKWASKWRSELPPEFTGAATEGQQEDITPGQSTSPAASGAAR